MLLILLCCSLCALTGQAAMLMKAVSFPMALCKPCWTLSPGCWLTSIAFAWYSGMLCPTAAPAGRPSCLAVLTVSCWTETKLAELLDKQQSEAHHDGLLQGSGWGWLAYNKDAGRLQVTTTANQDPIAIQVLSFSLLFASHEYFFALDPCIIYIQLSAAT